MSKLSWIDDGPLAPQTVLANVAASDAGPKRKRRRKGAPPSKRKPPPLAFGEWVVVCYPAFGDRFFFDFKGSYIEAVAYRDKHLASGRYEKAWLRSKI